VLPRIVTGVAVVVLGFLGGVQAQRVVAAAGEPEPVTRAVDPRAHEVVHEDCPRLPAAPPYPVNDAGMTYGSGAGTDAEDPGPDLVAAHGTDGRCGFVRATDLPRPAEPASPGPGGPGVPLYARDGVTVIGTSAADEASGAPQPRPTR
jgi:hypothetical protein